MKYYSKDYASSIITDEEELRIKAYMQEEKKRQFLKASDFQLRYGNIGAVLFAILSIVYFITYLGNFVHRSEWIVLAMGVVWGIEAVFFYKLYRNAKVSAANPGKV